MNPGWHPNLEVNDSFWHDTTPLWLIRCGNVDEFPDMLEYSMHSHINSSLVFKLHKELSTYTHQKKFRVSKKLSRTPPPEIGPKDRNIQSNSFQVLRLRYSRIHLHTTPWNSTGPPPQKSFNPWKYPTNPWSNHRYWIQKKQWFRLLNRAAKPTKPELRQTDFAVWAEGGINLTWCPGSDWWSQGMATAEISVVAFLLLL